MSKVFSQLLCALVVLLINSPEVLPQTGEIQQLSRISWDHYQRKFFSRKIGVQKPIAHPSNPITLVNGEKIVTYAKKEFHLYGVKENNTDERVILSVLVGFDEALNMVVMADRNFNKTFNDDEVYKIDMQKDFASQNSFFESVPVITIDSIKLKNGEQTIYRSLSLKIAATPVDKEYFKNRNEIKGIEDFHITIYTLYAYATPFLVGNDVYEILLVPDPLTEPFFNLPATANLSTSFIVYKKREGDVDSLAVFIPFRYLTEGSEEQRVFSLGNDVFALKQFLPAEQKISFQKTQRVVTKINIDPFTAFSVKRNKQVSFDTLQRLTVIEFSGSWCKPCELVLPDLKEMHKRFTGVIDFITIAKENNLAAANLYYNRTGIGWEMVYENLNCSQDSCLASKFKIAAYPTLILLDKKGTILFKQSGTAAVVGLKESIERFYNNDALEKRGY